jgi:hypothetical protein
MARIAAACATKYSINVSAPILAIGRAARGAAIPVAGRCRPELLLNHRILHGSGAIFARRAKHARFVCVVTQVSKISRPRRKCVTRSAPFSVSSSGRVLQSVTRRLRFLRRFPHHVAQALQRRRVAPLARLIRVDRLLNRAHRVARPRFRFPLRSRNFPGHRKPRSSPQNRQKNRANQYDSLRAFLSHRLARQQRFRVSQGLLIRAAIRAHLAGLIDSPFAFRAAVHSQTS